ncbi:hypothetical protein LNP17_18225 [Klebsiella variicola subsp. variicola]|nr:hypothetical protein [Klebsiella variicola subsp. variicola]
MKRRAASVRRRPPSICSSCCAWGCRHVSTRDWKYTPLDALLNGHFVADEGASLSAEQRDALALPLDAWRLVFIDGRYHPELSDDLAASGAGGQRR